MTKAQILLVLTLVTATCGLMAADVVVVSNKNLAECRTAAAKILTASGTLPGLHGTIPLVELDGTAADDKALEKLKELHPKVVISLASYATHMVQQTLPDTWVVYALVPYPEVEGFTREPKMVGIEALGSEAELFRLASGLGSVRRLAVLHSDVISPSVQPMLARLKEAGFSAMDVSLSQAPLLDDVVSKLVKQCDAVLLLPDPLTANPYALRFIVTTCLKAKILTLTNDFGLVGNGVLCGTYVSPEASGTQAAIVAGKILAVGVPPAHPVVFFRGSRPSVSLAALGTLNLRPPKMPDLVVQ